jgi:hypothetical protein
MRPAVLRNLIVAATSRAGDRRILADRAEREHERVVVTRTVDQPRC